MLEICFRRFLHNLHLTSLISEYHISLFTYLAFPTTMDAVLNESAPSEPHFQKKFMDMSIILTQSARAHTENPIMWFTYQICVTFDHFLEFLPLPGPCSSPHQRNKQNPRKLLCFFSRTTFRLTNIHILYNSPWLFVHFSVYLVCNFVLVSGVAFFLFFFIHNCERIQNANEFLGVLDLSVSLQAPQGICQIFG